MWSERGPDICSPPSRKQNLKRWGQSYVGLCVKSAEDVVALGIGLGSQIVPYSPCEEIPRLFSHSRCRSPRSMCHYCGNDDRIEGGGH